MQRLVRLVRQRPLSAIACATFMGVPITGAFLVVNGTSVGKIFVPSPNFLLNELNEAIEEGQLEALKEEAIRLISEGFALRYNFPPGKAGAAVSYGVLQRESPTLCDFYSKFSATVSKRLQLPLVPTPKNDNSSLSLLVYSRIGDHIDWHYDLNHYKGRHFTVLIPLIVKGPVDSQLQVALPLGAQKKWGDSGLQPVRHASASQEVCEAILGPGEVQDSGNRFPNASVEVIPTAVGSVVAFEGAVVFHRVTPLGASIEPWKSSWEPPPSAPNGTREGFSEEEAPLRVVLSMTYATDTSAGILSTFQRRLKDMTYFGLLAALFG